VNEGCLYVGDTSEELPAQPSPQLVLGRYLALVQLLRAWSPGQPLPLRTDDLAVLGESLGLAPSTVERQLLDLLERGHSVEGLARLRRRLVIPAAGFLVGTTVVGALVLVRIRSSEPASESTPTSVPSLATAGDPPGPGVVPSDVATEGPIGTEPIRTPLAESPTPFPETPVVADIGEPVAIEGQAVTGTDPVLGEPLVATPTAAPSGVRSDAVASEIGEAAESAITYPWRDFLPGWSIAYLDGDVVSGNTNVPTQTISVWLPADASAGYVSEVLAHEIGHAIDVSYLSDLDRGRWLEARGIPDADWWPSEAASDFDVGAGDFAEAVAAWLTGSPSDSVIGGSLTSEQLELVGELLP
jgi:hypothetical protein